MPVSVVESCGCNVDLSKDTKRNVESSEITKGAIFLKSVRIEGWKLPNIHINMIFEVTS